MNTLMLTLVAAALTAAVLALVWVGRLKAEVEALRRQAEVPDPPLPPEALNAVVAEGDTVIVIRVLNHLEAAKYKTWLAGPVGSMSPGLIRKIVHSQTIKITNQELAKRGVQAEVFLHGG